MTARFTFTKSLYQSPQTKAIERLPACLPCRPRHYPTIIRIMQLGRSYSRRLKSVKNEIYELFPSARHAYITIRPAVKTSRPRFKEHKPLGTYMSTFWAYPSFAKGYRGSGFRRYTVACLYPLRKTTKQPKNGW